MDFAYRRRKFVNLVSLAGIFGLAVLAAVPFFVVSVFVLDKGLGAISWDFFTQLPKGPGEEGGGMANAIVGSAMMVGLAAVLSIPWGLAAGIFMSEYGDSRTARCLRFTTDLLASTPSIVVGIFVYGLIVVYTGFSAWAGAAALTVIMLPIVARTSEEMLKLVPDHVREAGLALGLPRWKVIVRLVLPAAKSGVITGLMLALARVAGETAPLLFTALGNNYHSESLNQPTASLPVQVYNYAMSPFEEMQQQAWAGALVLVLFVVVINLSTRLLLRSKQGWSS